MPTTIVKQECTDSKGNKGSFVLMNKKTGKGEGCFQTRADAKKAQQIRQMMKKTKRGPDNGSN